MRIQLSDHFNYNRLIRFVLPSILMMIFTSLYTIVDGFFVSNFVGKTPFAALNFIWPVIQAVSGIGFMIATGGSAYVAKLLGQNKNEYNYIDTKTNDQILNEMKAKLNKD